MKRGRALAGSVRALGSHRARTALTVGGMAVGVCGVLLTSAVGKGAEAEVRRGIEAVGPSLLVVRPARVKLSAARRNVRGVVSSLRLEDRDAIAELPMVAEAAAGVDGGARVSSGAGAAPAGVLGTAPSLARLRGLRVRAGRFFDEEDDVGAARVAVLGCRIAASLFGSEPAVGREIRLRGLPFEVVGVLEPIGLQADGADQDGTVFVPVRTALRRVFNTTFVTTVFVGVAEPGRMQETQTAIRALLRERHRLAPEEADDFDVQDQARLLAMRRQAIGSVTLFTAGLAGVSMVVAGVGILALMLLSVKERTAEIGLRIAVGARPADVLVQFLGEAAVLALGGWSVGVVAAVAGAAAIALGTEWKVSFPVGAAASSLASALLLGLGFGAMPALRAARLTPVAALGRGREG